MTTAPLYTIDDLRWQLSTEFSLCIPSLVLPRGQTIVLLGASGSGKSTLLSLLGRVEGSYFPSPDPLSLTGSIRLTPSQVSEPIELLTMSERALMNGRVRGGILGFVFQREGLFEALSVVDNVGWALRAHGLDRESVRRQAHEALERVGLSANREVATLSGGERKRLALARTLALDPPVLLLDEPFTGLDPRSLGELLDLMASIASEPERTVVMVSHQREDIERLAEHVVILNQGQVAVAGSRVEVGESLAAFLAGEAFVTGSHDGVATNPPGGTA